MTPPTCETCRFWSGHPRTGAVADCRRHAPERDLSAAFPYRSWPMTDPRDWCGEYEPRETTVGEYLYRRMR